MVKKLPPLDPLVAFVSVVQTGTIAEAAKELSITPSAVSQRLKQLETQYDFPLFQRVKGRLEPTEKGQMLAEVCANSFDKIAQVSSFIAETNNASDLKISCLPSFAYLCLVTRLSEFEATGNYKINLDTSNVLVDFQNSDCDIAVRYTNDTSDARLDFQLISDEVVYPCVSPEIIEKVGTTNLSQITKHYPLIMDSGLGLDIKPNWPKWIDLYEQFDIESCKTIQFSDYQFAVKSALDGKGILLARSVIVADEVKKGNLIRINRNQLNSDASYYLVTRKDIPLKKSAALFYKWFISEFQHL